MKIPKLPISKKKQDTVGHVAKKKLPPTGLPSAKRLAMKSLSSIAGKSVADILEAPCGIDVSNLSDGTYVLVANQDGVLSSGKFTVKH